MKVKDVNVRVGIWVVIKFRDVISPEYKNNNKINNKANIDQDCNISLSFS